MKATGAGWWESLQDRALLGPPGLFYQADPGRIDEVFWKRRRFSPGRQGVRGVRSVAIARRRALVGRYGC